MTGVAWKDYRLTGGAEGATLLTEDAFEEKVERTWFSPKIDRAEFRKLIDRHPQWYAHFAKVLCNKLRVCFDYIEDMAVLNLQQRVAKRLLDLAQVYGKAEGGLLAIDLHLPQDDLARMLGATRQSINQALRTLEAQNLIVMEKQGRIALRDQGGLNVLVASARGG